MSSLGYWLARKGQDGRSQSSAATSRVAGWSCSGRWVPADRERTRCMRSADVIKSARAKTRALIGAKRAQWLMVQRRGGERDLISSIWHR